MLPQAHGVCLCSVEGTHWLCCHPTGQVLRTQPEGYGGSRATSAYELIGSNSTSHRVEVHVQDLPRSCYQPPEEINLAFYLVLELMGPRVL